MRQKKDDKGEREQRCRAKFSARIFSLGWEIKKALEEAPDGKFPAALMSQPLTFGHFSQKAPANTLMYSQHCGLGTGFGLIHPCRSKAQVGKSDPKSSSGESAVQLHSHWLRHPNYNPHPKTMTPNLNLQCVMFICILRKLNLLC